LRRVATLVARGARPGEVFSAVSDEVARLIGCEAAIISFETDGSGFVIAGVSDGFRGTSIRERYEHAEFLAATGVYRTGRSARNDDIDIQKVEGPAGDLVREMSLFSTVAAPIVVEDSLWGALLVADASQHLPADTEGRVERFTDLVATAIANADSRAELAASEARAHSLAREQAALRRVATLIARAASAEEVFSAVAEELASVLNLRVVTVCRYREDAVVVLSSLGIPAFPAGSRWPLDDPSLPGSVYRTGGPVRIDDFTDDLTGAAGIYAMARDGSVKSALGAPIIVDGAVWGSVNAGSTEERAFPPDAEERLARFTDLVATSVQNATMRDQLAASRARVIAAADESRRRIERDLHDGAQQQLVTLALDLRLAEAKIPRGLDELRADVGRVAQGLTDALQELRETSRGIHPAVLTLRGLSPALEALARRSNVLVELDLRCERRFPEQVEAAAYYIVSEALTNASKHAAAARAWVSLYVEDGTLYLSVRDDGVGGADPSRGSGLIGLKDRVEALGGTIEIDSPPGAGTRVSAAIPAPLASR
jgi:signal transduction histidine kinase